MKQKALQIYLTGVNRVLPDALVRKNLQYNSDIFTNSEKIYVLAIGKAAFLMAKEAEKILNGRITEGLVVTKYEHGGKLRHLKVIEAGHPIQDENGVKAARQVLKVAEKAKENDIVLCLISGGASALLADYPAESTLADLKEANEQLINSGATISEINCVRKHLSAIKGGQLTKLTFPAKTISLLLSDVIGDRLDVIASGITVPDKTTFSDALDVIKKYNLTESFPPALINHMNKGQSGLIPDTPKSNNPIFNRVENHIIGNNQIALKGAAEKATELGFYTKIITDSLEGDYRQVAEYILKSIDKETQAENFNKQSYNYNKQENNSNDQETSGFQKNQSKLLCLLFGGEPTVKVTGTGKGGRNQHLALYLANKINDRENITILCAGTDGTDGPTDSAGAIVDGFTLKHSFDNNINPEDYLSNFDSYNFFKQLGDSVKTGNSGTNVMDMIVVLINQN